MTWGATTISNCLSDLWEFHLVIVGISLSIFTLLYSFILNKRDELRNIAEQIKNSGTNPSLVQKEKFAITYIRRLKKLNINCIRIFIVSTILCICSWITLRLVSDFYISIAKWATIIILSLTVILCVYIAIQFAKIYRHYIQETKV
jgi:hypothetical protein